MLVTCANTVCETRSNNHPSCYPRLQPPTPSPTSAPRPQTTIGIAGETQPQSRSRHRFQCQLHVHAAFSFPSFPFPHSHSHCDSLLPFPFPLFPFHFHLLGFDFVAWPCNFKSQRQLSQRIYWACCLCICITLQKKKKNNKHININSIIMYEGCLRKNMNTLRDVQNFVNTHKIVRKKCKSALKTFTTF